MTRDEFRDAWAAASPNQRFTNFVELVQTLIEDVAHLLPPISIVQDAGTATIAQLGGGNFSINPNFFTDGSAAGANAAVAAADAIAMSLLGLAMDDYKKWLEEKKKYEKDAKKEREKYWEKLLKDSKPKAKDPASIYYEIYVKPLEELEKGSG